MKKVLATVLIMFIILQNCVTTFADEVENNKQECAYLDEYTIIESNRYTGNMGDSYIRPSGKLNDIYGNEYERGLAIWIARWNAGHEKSWAWVKYNINNEYEYLQSDLVLVPSNNTTNFDTILDFYGDGKLLGSYEFRATDLPIKVAVNVSGVNELKIYFHDNEYTGWGTRLGLANCRLSYELDESYGDEKTEFYKWMNNMPTLPESEARNFLAFIYNSSSIQKADLDGNDYYNLITGNIINEVDNADEVKQRIWSFSSFTRSMLNNQSAESQYHLEYISNDLEKYLKYKYADQSDEELIIKDIKAECENILKKYLKELYNSDVSEYTDIKITDEIFDEAYLVISTIDSISSLPEKINNFVDDVVAGFETGLYVLNMDVNGRSSYFNCYLQNRGDYESSSDEIFRTVMDYNEFAISDNTYFSNILNYLTWLDGKDSWTKHIDEIENWAEYLYNLEKYMEVEQHEWITSRVEPTCTEYGYTKEQCAICSQTKYHDYTEPIGHEWNNGEVIKKPSYGEEGVLRFYCKKCNDYYDQTIEFEPKIIEVEWENTMFTYDGKAHLPKAIANGVADGEECDVIVDGEQTDAGTYEAIAVDVTNRNYALPNENIIVNYTINKAERDLPKVSTVDESSVGANDGKIKDVDSTMEFRGENEILYKDIDGKEISNLSPGNYFVRFKETKNYYASPDVEVNILSAQVLMLDNVKLGKFINTNSGIQINWEKVKGAKLYKVYRKQSGTNWVVLSNNVMGTSYTDTTAKDRETYYYTVRAINGNVMSPSFDGSKNIECVKKLNNVELKGFVNTDNGVQISWEGVEGAKLYKVYRKQLGTNWIVLSSNEVDTSYTDVTAKDGKTYYYTVRAINGSVMSPSFDSTKNIECIKTLENVKLQSFANTNNGVQISWENVEGAKLYKVYRKQSGTNWIVLSSNEVDTSYTDVTAKDGETYYYTVRAVNGKVMSPSYDSSKYIVCIKKLKNVSSIKLKNISSGVQISWEKVDGTKQYKVYRKQPETGWIVLSNNVVETNYVDTTVKNGETYYYTVRAVNDKVMSPSYDSDKVIVY